MVSLSPFPLCPFLLSCSASLLSVSQLFLSISQSSHPFIALSFTFTCASSIPVFLPCFLSSLRCAIVGVTDQYIHERISHDDYDFQIRFFSNEVLQKNPETTLRSIANKTYEEEHEEEQLMIQEGKLPPDPEGLRIREKLLIPLHFVMRDDESRFMLLRHWNLYEAMFHSHYVATKLGISQPFFFFFFF